MPAPTPSARLPLRPILACLALGLLTTLAIPALEGRPDHQYGGGRLPLMAPYDPKLGVEGGRYAQSRSWLLTVYSVRLRDGETPDPDDLRRTVAAIPYGPDISWVAVTRTPAPPDRPLPDATWWSEWRAGFPLRAMACSFTDDFRGTLHAQDAWCLPAGSAYGVPRHWIIPARILWPGLLADTALFAAAFASLWAARPLPAALARALRTPPGHCPTCGYDQAGLDDHAPCPECGRPNPTP